MNTEIIIATISVIGGIVSMIAAVASVRREEIKARRETKRLADSDAERKRLVTQDVANDTVGLYRSLAEQYQAMTAKDRKLLRTVTFVIRHLIVLDRVVSDMISEMDAKWDTHQEEAETLACPFYEHMTSYMYARAKGIEDIVRETMDEVDTLLLNGNGDHKDE